MRLDRMLGITLELMTKRRVTATELAARFEVSIRTVYRDIELINQAGIPVASFAGTDGGFELMDGFFLTKQHFSVDDFAVIYNLLKSMEGAVGGKLTTLKNKLGSLHPALANGGCDDKLIFDMSASEGERAIIHPLYNAIHQSKRVAFSYTGASGTVSERRVEPIRLYWERGVWYLEGYCLLRHGIRFFRITRMTKFHVSEEVFQPREASTETPPETTDGMQVHLRFDLNAQPRVFEQFPGECVHQGTHIDVHTTCYSTEYALSIVLSYGSKAVIVSPDELKRAFIDELKEMQKRYVQNDGEEK